MKWLVHTIEGFLFKMAKQERSFFAMALSQGGAFAFVLFPAALSGGVLSEETIESLISKENQIQSKKVNTRLLWQVGP